MLKKLWYSVFLFLIVQCHSWQVNQTNFSHVEIQKAGNHDSSLKLISIYKQQLEKETQTIIAHSTHAFIKSDNEHSLGNFVCDAIKFTGEKVMADSSDVVIITRGGLRSDLPKGSIYVYHIYELMPFENELVWLSISGKQLKEGLSTIIEKRHSFKGLQLIITDKNEILSMKVNGKELDENKSYRILTSDYLANGGDHFNFLLHPLESKPIPIKVRDAIIRYCQYFEELNQPITPYTDGRLQVSK